MMGSVWARQAQAIGNLGDGVINDIGTVGIKIQEQSFEAVVCSRQCRLRVCR